MKDGHGPRCRVSQVVRGSVCINAGSLAIVAYHHVATCAERSGLEQVQRNLPHRRNGEVLHCSADEVATQRVGSMRPGCLSRSSGMRHAQRQNRSGSAWGPSFSTSANVNMGERYMSSAPILGLLWMFSCPRACCKRCESLAFLPGRENLSDRYLSTTELPRAWRSILANFRICRPGRVGPSPVCFGICFFASSLAVCARVLVCAADSGSGGHAPGGSPPRDAAARSAARQLAATSRGVRRGSRRRPPQPQGLHHHLPALHRPVQRAGNAGAPAAWHLWSRGPGTSSAGEARARGRWSSACAVRARESSLDHHNIHNISCTTHGNCEGSHFISDGELAAVREPGRGAGAPRRGRSRLRRTRQRGLTRRPWKCSGSGASGTSAT